MTVDNPADAVSSDDLSTISLALAVIALNQSGAEAANADERKRYDDATRKCVKLLLQRIEAL